MKTEEKLILVFHEYDVEKVNDLLKDGWKVKMMSSSSTSFFNQLVVVEREVK